MSHLLRHSRLNLLDALKSDSKVFLYNNFFLHAHIGPAINWCSIPALPANPNVFAKCTLQTIFINAPTPCQFVLSSNDLRHVDPLGFTTVPEENASNKWTSQITNSCPQPIVSPLLRAFPCPQECSALLRVCTGASLATVVARLVSIHKTSCPLWAILTSCTAGTANYPRKHRKIWKLWGSVGYRKENVAEAFATCIWKNIQICWLIQASLLCHLFDGIVQLFGLLHLRILLRHLWQMLEPNTKLQTPGASNFNPFNHIQAAWWLANILNHDLQPVLVALRSNKALGWSGHRNPL